MKYLSIDIETTGLDFEECQTIELGIIADDLYNQQPAEHLPKFHCYIDHGIFRGDPFALSMHANILRRISLKEKGYEYLRPIDVALNVKTFLENVRRRWSVEDKSFDAKKDFNVAGKNYGGFDFNFLYRLPGFKQSGGKLLLADYGVGMSARCLDSGNHFWEPNDTRLPDTKTCCERAGTPVNLAHTALEDAWTVCLLVRRQHSRMVALQEFMEAHPDVRA